MNSLVISHYSGMSGLGEKVADFLETNVSKPIFVRTPLIVEQKESLIDLNDGERISFRIPRLIQYLSEGIIIYRRLKKLQKKGKISTPMDIAIGMDPLAVWNIFLLKRLLGIKKIVFFNSDYAVKRFSNPILNYIYHRIDRFAFRRCDVYCCASEMINDIRRKQFPDMKDKIRSVPHSVSLRKARVYDSGSRWPCSLVFVGCLSESIEWEFVFAGMKEAMGKIPNLSLDIYGDGQERSRVEDLIEHYGLCGQVKLHGSTSHEEILNTIGKYQVGIAPYRIAETSDKAWWNYGSGFTMKLVDYLACGLPVLTTGLIPGFDELEKKKAGLIVANSADDFAEKLLRLFSDEELLIDYQRNARSLSQAYDSDRIYAELVR